MLLIFDVMQLIFIIQCTLQLNYSSKLLESLKQIDDENRKDVKGILQQVLESHIMLRDFVNKMYTPFAVFVLLQLMQPSIDLAVSVYIVTSVPPEHRSLELFIYAVMIIYELGIFCFAGQYLTDKFEELYDNMLEVSWDDFTLEEKRNFLIILHNIQQPVILKTYFTELSVVVFRNVSYTEFIDSLITSSKYEIILTFQLTFYFLELFCSFDYQTIFYTVMTSVINGTPIKKLIVFFWTDFKQRVHLLRYSKHLSSLNAQESAGKSNFPNQTVYFCVMHITSKCEMLKK